VARTADAVGAADAPGDVPRPPGGTGLAGLRERLAAVGGSLDVAAHGHEFTVTARVPSPGATA
jgi:two-component system sensor histidine kinase DesK